MKVLIVGAGISGLAAGQFLRARGVNPDIIEKESHSGGLIHCAVVEGFLYHLVGGHVFNSKNSEILEWFWSYFNKDSEFNEIKRNAKILLNGSYVGYPIENHLFQLDSITIKSVLRELLSNYQKHVTASNFYEFLLSKFGETLCRLYFFPYNEKIWQSSLKEISLDWLEGKLPSPDVVSILINNILRNEERDMVHSSFYYPKHGGSQFIVNRLSEKLNIKTSTLARKVFIKKGNKLVVDGNVYDKIIYTGDIRCLSEVIVTDDKNLLSELSCVQNLMAHGTSNLLCECDKTDISWLYLPDRDLRAHRIIYTGNFSSLNNRDSVRSSCVVEFSGIVAEEEMKAEVARLPGNLRPIASNQQRASYVIHNSETNAKMANVIQLLNFYNVYPLGRFAEWQYYNMDKVMESAKRLVDGFF